MRTALTLKPRLFEKTYALSQQGVYVFDVDKSANKHSIARAVESQFEVKVTAVNTTNIQGKAKRTISIMGKRMSNQPGVRNDFKKAYVTLAKGQTLPFFDAAEAAEEKSNKIQEKVDKAVAKQADKASKSDKTDATDKPVRKLTLGRKPKTEKAQEK